MSSSSRSSGSKTKPKLKTPPKPYIRNNEESEEVTGDESNQTPSDNSVQQRYKEADVSASDEDSQDDDGAAATTSATKQKRTYVYTLPASSSKRQHEVERTDNREEPSSTQLPGLRETPMALWKTIDDSMKQVKVEKTAVHDFVANYLFPKLKFVRGTAVVNMEYSTDTKSLCALVMAGCHQEHSAEGMIWWATARKQTIQEIKRLRNDASKNLKTAFLGKSTMGSVLTTQRRYTHLCRN
jgi:hypothetical protein